MSRFRVIVLALVALLVLSATTLAFLYTDYLWFSSLGLKEVFTTQLSIRIGLWILGGLIFFAILMVNLKLAEKNVPRYYLGRAQEIIFFQNMNVQRYAKTIFIAAAGFMSFIAAGAASRQTWNVLAAFNASSFGVKDPIFLNDAGFYVFALPAIFGLLGFLVWAIIASVVLAGAFYLVNGAIALAQGAREFAPFVVRHVKILGGLFAILGAAGVYLLRYGLLWGGRGVVNGAGYADASGTLPVMGLLSLALLLFGLLLLLEGITARRLRTRLAFGAVAVLGLAAIFYPAVIQQLRVLPNELTLERPYIERSIAFTRKAYGLENVEERSFESKDNLRPSDLTANKSTVDNIRLWDWRPLLTTYSQIQEIRTYYQFNDVDVDRYTIDGKQRQLMVAARELSVDDLDERARTWVNQHQIYLHGYGAVANPVNQIGAEGLPEMLLRDIPPKTDVDELKVDRPQIYFGEMTDSYGIVKTGIKEFDYPGRDENVYSTYAGPSGVTLDSAVTRLAFALRFSALKILLSDAITDKSRMLMNRNVTGMAKTIAPFLRYDGDPYLVITNGELKWIVDAYTVTGRFPYSEFANAPGEETSSINYVRNSVKVVIDAYDGQPTFYVADSSDPLIRTYQKIFPSLFTPIAEMPKDIRSHVRYPVDLFEIQSAILNTYHMRSPEVFYNREDQWIIPDEIFGSETIPVEPYYVTTRLPGETADEFVLLRPFSPRGKSNLVAWLAAQNDGENYGRLIMFKFPKDRLVYGTMQMESLINQDPQISSQLTLWNREGSRVIRGNLIVVPIEESLIYVEPIYLQAETSELPELKRVVVGYKGKVAMESSLGAALRSIFGDVSGIAEGGGARDGDGATGDAAAGREGQTSDTQTGDAQISAQTQQLIDQANNHLRRAEEAQRKGDWAAYGREIEALRQSLRRLTESSN